MEGLDDLEFLSEYREDNRIEAKRAQGGLPHVGLEGIQRGGGHEQKGRQAHPQQQEHHAQQLFPRKLQAVFHSCPSLSKSNLALPHILTPSSIGPHC